ncbi:tumor necrosis factor receptor superfamily member 17 [Alosa alosa]|uniref:tumor necrosis factor receptor superfamily member 17 n=1 Tax=Alosa sapidissima TaxID=34773 RepID=UPI001C096576|nr:tumor necrosis factor receptor superfamily member 17 [Alosa sapidissima]XP_048089496.1 tumor necrosis factor receptor superfamily member 17 [Alosa alosa]
MLFYLGLIVYISPLSLAVKQCPVNHYYDGLSEECEPCELRCNSPPATCTASCTKNMSESQGNNSRVLLVVLFVVFLGVFMAMSLILQYLRRKTCKIHSKPKVPCQEETGPTELQEALYIAGTETLAGAGQAIQEEQSEVTPNSSLPLPSTEEGRTMLVTTKTGQNYGSRMQSTDSGALYLWRSGFVP